MTFSKFSKSAATFSLLVFIIFVGFIFLIGLTGDNTGNNQSNTNIPMPNTVAVPVGQTITLSMSELAKHNSKTDCWLLINNNIYNVSSYMDMHPGAASTIIPSCGKEATHAFDTKKQGQPHSSYADSLLKDYLVGSLDSTITGKSINSQNIPLPSTSPVPQGRGSDD